jgi:DNA-directed RNA polymerase subunit M/transcription elongation factor TFIIS
MDGGGSVVEPDAVAIVLQELQVCRDASVDKAQDWLENLQDQLDLFKAQRKREDQDDDDLDGVVSAAGGGVGAIVEVPPEDLRYFECISHLLWWTVCSAVAFFSGEHPRETAAQIVVPGQKDFDDFLCLMPLRCYQDHESRLAAALCNILNAYDSHESICKTAFPEDDTDDVADTRDRMMALFTERCPSEAIDAETLTHQLELGCNLYASMVATVDSSRDALALVRWRECYLAKCKQVAEWLASVQSQETKPIWDRATAEPDYALLVPFTHRTDLFAGRRLALHRQLYTHLVAAKKLFDVEHDNSQIESDFKCPKCGSFKTRSYHLQMSSADESMAQLWKCWNCKKSGKKR